MTSMDPRRPRYRRVALETAAKVDPEAAANIGRLEADWRAEMEAFAKSHPKECAPLIAGKAVLPTKGRVILHFC